MMGFERCAAAVPQRVLPIGDETVVAARETQPMDVIRFRVDESFDLARAGFPAWPSPAAHSEWRIEIGAGHGDDDRSEMGGKLQRRPRKLGVRSAVF